MKPKLPKEKLKGGKSVTFTPLQLEFLETRDNASEYIRGLLDKTREFKNFQKRKE